MENISSGSKSGHIYQWDDIPESTTTSEGYRQVLVTVTPRPGSQLTYTNIATNHAIYAEGFPSINWLDISLSVPNSDTGASIVMSYGGDYEEFAPLAQRVRIFNSGNATDFTSLFKYYPSLQDFHLGENQVEIIDLMFEHCPSLKALTLPNLPKVESAEFITRSSYSVRSIEIGDLPLMGSLVDIFRDYPALKSIKIGNCPLITEFGTSFLDLDNLESLEIGDCTSLLSMGGAFVLCEALKSFKIGNLPLAFNFESTFSECASLISVEFSSLPAADQMGYMFFKCESLEEVVLPDLPLVEETMGMFEECGSLRHVTFGETPNLLFAYDMFFECRALESVTLGDLPVIEDMEGFFSQCHSLKSISFGDLPSVIYMGGLAYATYSLTSFTVGETPLLEDVWEMFGESSIIEINEFDVSSAVDMTDMFINCGNLQKGALSGTQQDISYLNCLLGRPAIVDIFNGLAEANQTIDVSGNYGAAFLTPGDLAIAEDKGWTVIF